MSSFSREVIEKLDSSVKCIVRIAMGYEIVDVEACSERGIYVCNIPDYAMEEVAVHQTALILACLRKMVYYDRKVREGAYDHIGYLEGYSARRISVLSVGLLGFGRIAKNVARYMQSFGAGGLRLRSAAAGRGLRRARRDARPDQGGDLQDL